MVKSVEFQKFIDLVTFDQNLVKIERDIKKSQEVQQSLVADLERLEEDFLASKATQLQARKAVDEKELYMKVLDTQEADIKRKLESISNHKEYKLLQKEASIINAERMLHEQQLLALWNKSDAVAKNYEAQRVAYEEQVIKYQTQIQAMQNELMELENQLKVATDQRVEKVQNIPREWLDMYINMKGRVSNPVIPVVNGVCDACFYSVTPRDLQLLRQNNLLQCRDCYRLLYITDDK